MCHITEFAKQKQVILRDIYWHFLKQTRDEILLAEPSNCHHPTSNQTGPIHQFHSLSLSANTSLLNSPEASAPLLL
jgi:hypothetical protein